MAVRAGQLFDSKTGQMLAKQVVLLQGDRITDVGPESQVKIPAGAKVIDLSQATVLPGLIDAHTHMFNPPRPGMSRETSTLIAMQNLQADLQAGFTTARDMAPTATATATSMCATPSTRAASTVRGTRCPAAASCGARRRPRRRRTR
jgi:imidazolonepropionase-like amidohydrolase